MIDKIKDLLIKYREIILYLFFGFVTTVSNFVAYAIAVRLFRLDLSKVKVEGNVINSIFHGASGRNIMLLFLATLIAWTVSVIVAFITNKLWVFNSKSWKPSLVLKEAGSFIAARILTGALEWFGTPALVLAGLNQSFLHIEGFPAKVIVSVIVVIVNYVLSKFIIFKKKQDE